MLPAGVALVWRRVERRIWAGLAHPLCHPSPPPTVCPPLPLLQMRDLPTNNPSIAVEVAARSTAARETAAAVSVAADGGGGGTNDASELEAPNPFAVEERRSKL